MRGLSTGASNCIFFYVVGFVRVHLSCMTSVKWQPFSSPEKRLLGLGDHDTHEFFAQKSLQWFLAMMKNTTDVFFFKLIKCHIFSLTIYIPATGSYKSIEVRFQNVFAYFLLSWHSSQVISTCFCMNVLHSEVFFLNTIIFIWWQSMYLTSIKNWGLRRLQRMWIIEHYQQHE